MSVQTYTPTGRREFIDSLELAASRRALTTLATDEEGSPIAATESPSYVAAGSAISFVGSVSKDRQADVLNSTLLAQLAANSQYDRETHTEQWYGFYRNVLENLGWVITNFGFQRYNEVAGALRMDKAALSLIGSVASGNALVVLAAALKVLEESAADSKAVTLFEANGSSGENGAFQLAACTESSSGSVETALGAFYFKAAEHKERFLFWEWETKNINFYFSAQSIALNLEIYSGVREVVAQKLGERASAFIAGLELAPV